MFFNKGTASLNLFPGYSLLTDQFLLLSSLGHFNKLWQVQGFPVGDRDLELVTHLNSQMSSAELSPSLKGCFQLSLPCPSLSLYLSTLVPSCQPSSSRFLHLCHTACHLSINSLSDVFVSFFFFSFLSFLKRCGKHWCEPLSGFSVQRICISANCAFQSTLVFLSVLEKQILLKILKLFSGFSWPGWKYGLRTVIQSNTDFQTWQSKCFMFMVMLIIGSFCSDHSLKAPQDIRQSCD